MTRLAALIAASFVAVASPSVALAAEGGPIPTLNQGIGTAVGQQFSAVLAGTTSLEDGLAAAQELTLREMTKAGYIK